MLVFLTINLFVLFQNTELVLQEYTLNLDDSGNIIGGDYVDQSASADRIDFAWNLLISDFPTGYFDNVRQIYQASVNGTNARHLTEAARSVMPLQRSNHVFLNARRGQFGVKPYKGFVRKSWSLRSGAGARITFSGVDTERQFDLIRIYELNEDHSLGPLLHVMHGKVAHRAIDVSGDVYISFFSPANTRGGGGFAADYELKAR